MRKGLDFNLWLGSTLSRYCSSAIGLAVGLLMIWPGVHVATGAQSPTLADTPPMIVDQTNNITTFIILRNPKQQDLQKGGVLSATDFVSQTTGRPLGANLTFAAHDAPKGGKPFYVIPNDMPAGGFQIVKVEVSNLWEAGESTASVLYNGEKIGTLKALKYLVPFAVSLQSATPDNPTINLKWKVIPTLILKNDDAMNYPVRWELAIGQKKITNWAHLHPKGTEKIEVVPDPAWFAWYHGLFKEDLQDGLLTLSYPATKNGNDVPLQVKTIPVKARLVKWPLLQQFASTGIILVLLFLGGVCSLVVSYWVPNRLRRRDFVEQLDALAGKIRDISMQIDSSLRVLVRVQRKRLLDILDSRWTLSPDIANIFAQCSRGITTLNRQVTLLGNIDKGYHQLEGAAKEEAAPPSLLDKIKKKLWQAENYLGNQEPEDADFQAAQGLITDARTRLAAFEQADPTFAQELAERVKKLSADFDPNNGIMGKTEQCKKLLAKLPPQLSDLNSKLKFTNPNEITILDYAPLDIQTAKLMVIQSYLACKSTPKIDLEGHLVENLGQNSWQAIREARLIVRQVNEGSSEKDIEEAIKNYGQGSEKAASLKIMQDPGVARAFLPVRLSVSLDRTTLNNTAARNKFTCVWDFDHDNLEETGWEVSHYFPKEKKGGYQVKASFKRDDGQFMTGTDGKPVIAVENIKVQPQPSEKRNDRLWTEAIYLIIVLFAALLALIGGGREQLAKMDLVPGLIGVFVLGFSADQIKNLLTQKAPGGGKQ